MGRSMQQNRFSGQVAVGNRGRTRVMWLTVLRTYVTFLFVSQENLTTNCGPCAVLCRYGNDPKG